MPNLNNQAKYLLDLLDLREAKIPSPHLRGVGEKLREKCCFWGAKALSLQAQKEQKSNSLAVNRQVCL